MAISPQGARQGLARPACAVVTVFLAASPMLARAQDQVAASGADSRQQMRAELQALQAEEAAARAAEQDRTRRIEALARQLGVVPAAQPIATIPAPSGGQPAGSDGGGSKSSFEIYGAAQLDYIQDFNRVDQNWDATLRPSRIPTTHGADGSNGQAILSVRQSRFGVQGGDEVGGMMLKGKFEFDLFGTGVDEGQTTFRLRHIYASWGPLLAGQTNTNWMDIDTFPNVVDYWGPNGMVFLRTPQIRLTWKGGPHEVAGALEYATNDIDPGGIREFDPHLGSAIKNDEKFPDLTGHYRYDGGWGHAQIGGILRQVGFDTPGAPDNQPKGHQTGWGVNLSSSINTWRKDKLQLSAVYGEGIATYMNDGGMDLGPRARMVATAPPTVLLSPEAVPLFGLMAYYDHYWNDQFSTSLGYSQTKVSNLNFQTGDAFNRGQYASANLLYTPFPQLLIGGEFMWGERKDKNGAVGDDSRVQLTVKYSFSSGNLRP
jgi:hypothetical protein